MFEYAPCKASQLIADSILFFFESDATLNDMRVSVYIRLYMLSDKYEVPSTMRGRHLFLGA